MQFPSKMTMMHKERTWELPECSEKK